MKRHITKEMLKDKIAELAKNNEKIDENIAYIDLAKNFNEQENQFEDYLSNHKYNGVLGIPPHWVPDHVKNQFFEARISIFNNTIDIVNKPHDPQDIKMEMGWKLGGKGYYSNPEFWAIPTIVVDDTSYKRDLNILIRLWSLVQKGKDEALREIAGDTAFPEYENIIIRERQSVLAKKKAGTEGLLKTVIRKLQCNNLKDLLDRLEVSDRIDDLFYVEDKNDQIDIHAVEVNREEKYISYSNRIGKYKSATFKTLQAHINDIKKTIK